MSQKKEITIYDIARKLNLSASTVSRALRDHPAIKQETTERIKTMAESMGYQQNPFASNLRMNRSNTIGVILPRFESTFMSAVVSGIEHVIRNKGYNLVVSQSTDSIKNEKDNIKALFNIRVEGLLISLSPETETLGHLDVLTSKNIPVVLFDRVGADTERRVTTVVINNRQAGYDATTHLLTQGCKRILYLGENQTCSVFGERARGYKDALTENGIALDPELMVYDNLNEGSGSRTLKKILDLEEKPDGIFAANDVSAVSLMTELKRQGFRIPEDIAIVGFNNGHVSRIVEPALTTINYPAVEMGRIAASSLMSMLDHKSHVATQNVVLKHALIVRGSSLRKKK
ncbi:MAG: LacI family DNA-binding transcriptional regulator [Bacteroidota bacterium]